MNQDKVICVTKESVYTEPTYVDKEWTYADLRELWPKGGGEIVDGLLDLIKNKTNCCHRRYRF